MAAQSGPSMALTLNFILNTLYFVFAFVEKCILYQVNYSNAVE